MKLDKKRFEELLQIKEAQLTKVQTEKQADDEKDVKIRNLERELAHIHEDKLDKEE